MTNLEYQSFRRVFYCSSSCDEGYSGPFEVESVNGAETWTIYVKGGDFRAAHAWLEAHRTAALSA